MYGECTDALILRVAYARLCSRRPRPETYVIVSLSAWACDNPSVDCAPYSLHMAAAGPAAGLHGQGRWRQRGSPDAERDAWPQPKHAKQRELVSCRARACAIEGRVRVRVRQCEGPTCWDLYLTVLVTLSGASVVRQARRSSYRRPCILPVGSCCGTPNMCCLGAQSRTQIASTRLSALVMPSFICAQLGKTALYLAANANKLDVVMALLEAGADTEAPNTVTDKRDNNGAVFQAVLLGRWQVHLLGPCCRVLLVVNGLPLGRLCGNARVAYNGWCLQQKLSETLRQRGVDRRTGMCGGWTPGVAPQPSTHATL